MREGKRLINLLTELGCHNSGIQDVCRKSQLTLERSKYSTGFHDFVIKTRTIVVKRVGHGHTGRIRNGNGKSWRILRCGVGIAFWQWC